MTARPAQTAAVRRTLHVGVPIDCASQTLADGGLPPTTLQKRPFWRWWSNRVPAGAGSNAIKPPRKLVLGWHLQPDFQYNPDPALASEVVLEFIEEGPEATRVEFQHWHLERHGAGWEKLRASMDSGWTEVLTPYERSLNRPKG